MKRWPVWIVLLYGLTLIALTVPAARMIFISPTENIKPEAFFGSWEYWVWIVVLVLNQAALLLIPVDLSHKRPAGKRSLFLQVGASALSMGLLLSGAALAVSEAFKGEVSFNWTGWIFWGFLLVSWVFWARLFAGWSLTMEADGLVRRTCRTLFRGSVLQLLIVVPCHIYVRSKDYCCAGLGTALGLACGLAVMLVSFGPGIFFLYLEQLKKTKNIRS